MLKQLGVLGALALTSTMLLSQTRELRGRVTDSMCGKKHMMKGVSDAQCTRECVKSGSDFALVVGDKVYTLKGDKAQLDKFAGANVVVMGDVSGSSIAVKQIKPAT